MRDYLRANNEIITGCALAVLVAAAFDLPMSILFLACYIIGLRLARSRKRMLCLLLALALPFCHGSMTAAQSKNNSGSFKIDSSDAILGAVMTSDEVSGLVACRDCRELNGLSTGARVAFKTGLFAGFKLWEYKRPEDRKKIKIAKWISIGAFAAATAWNARK